MLQIQANISGYFGKPASVFAGFDEETGILVVAKLSDQIPRRDSCILISSDGRSDRDSLFSNADLEGSITDYFKIKGRIASDGVSGCLRITDGAMRSDPVSAIEKDGIDASGPRYRVASEASNYQIGVLAICRYVSKIGAISDSISMADKLAGLLSGRAITI